MCSVVVRDQGPRVAGAGGTVVPDACGHGQEPLGDPGVQALGGAAAVAFEVELAFEGVVDALDPLEAVASTAKRSLTSMRTLRGSQKR
jgi:hypothetical protein